MTTSMHYPAVEKLADSVEEAATLLSKGGKAAGNAPIVAVPLPIPQLAVPSGKAFGNTSAGLKCLSEYAQADAAALGATGNLGTTLSDDAERLRDAVRTFKRMDHAQADEILAAARNGVNIYSAHVHSSGSNNDDLVRAGQIARLRGVTDGPAVVGADLNSEAAWRTQSGAAIRAFEGDGFEVGAGDVGGTSHSGKRIDFVMPRGISAGPPTRVDGGTSDHDGQSVDLTIPRW